MHHSLFIESLILSLVYNEKWFDSYVIHFNVTIVLRYTIIEALMHEFVCERVIKTDEYHTTHSEKFVQCFIGLCL